MAPAYSKLAEIDYTSHHFIRPHWLHHTPQCLQLSDLHWICIDNALWYPCTIKLRPVWFLERYVSKSSYTYQYVRELKEEGEEEGWCAWLMYCCKDKKWVPPTGLFYCVGDRRIVKKDYRGYKSWHMTYIHDLYMSDDRTRCDFCDKGRTYYKCLECRQPVCNNAVCRAKHCKKYIRDFSWYDSPPMPGIRKEPPKSKPTIKIDAACINLNSEFEEDTKFVRPSILYWRLPKFQHKSHMRA